ncbi:MAG TPA: heme exporter protein CcmD [Burkholderiales bacterium]|nr:heme exporter protein CcmD [Burkholderiales bacterium]
MNWSSTEQFIAMGGYGFYVWGSFLATAACLAIELLLLRARRRHALQQVRAERVRHEAAA